MTGAEPASRRAVLWMAAVVGGLVVVMLVMLAAVMAAHRAAVGVPAATACHLRTPLARPIVGTDGGVAIVERGHSMRPLGDSVSMGVVLQNTTQRVAYRTRVTFDVLDPAGKSAVWDAHRELMSQEVPVILPGAKVAVGDAMALRWAAWSALIRRPAVTVSVTVTVGRWLEPGDTSTGLAPVTATVIAGEGRHDDDESGWVRYNAVSANCAPLAPRGYSMVFRNRAGRIVGGSFSRDPTHHACDPGRSGPHFARSMPRSVPAFADLDRTEVTPYCDLARPDN